MQEPKLDDLGKLLRYASTKAKHQPFFVAWWIAQYGALTGYNDEDIINMLEIMPTNYVRLLLCRKPETDAEISKVADYCSANGQKLKEIIQYVEQHHI